ncbi:hypothetical protein [Streptomyces sp. NPDC002104]
MSRRTDRNATRTTYRAQADILLARYARHAPIEADALRVLVEAERAEGDRARREAAGQQAAVRREQQRLAAAEQAIVEAEQRAEDAEQALAAIERHPAVEEQLAESEAAGLRWANYLVAAQNACGAPNWPALPDTIRASVPEATRERARYRLAWRSARRRALAAEGALAAELITCAPLDQAAA